MDTKKIVFCIRILINNDFELSNYKAVTYEISERLYSLS